MNVPKSFIDANYPAEEQQTLQPSAGPTAENYANATTIHPGNQADYVIRGVAGNTAVNAVKEMQQKRKRRQLESAYEQLLERGEQAADAALKDAYDVYGEGVIDYLPPKEYFVDPESGTFRTHDYMKAIFVGVNKFKADKKVLDAEEQHKGVIKRLFGGAEPEATAPTATTITDGAEPESATENGATMPAPVAATPGAQTIAAPTSAGMPSFDMIVAEYAEKGLPVPKEVLEIYDRYPKQVDPGEQETERLKNELMKAQIEKTRRPAPQKPELAKDTDVEFSANKIKGYRDQIGKEKAKLTTIQKLIAQRDAGDADKLLQSIEPKDAKARERLESDLANIGLTPKSGTVFGAEDISNLATLEQIQASITDRNKGTIPALEKELSVEQELYKNLKKKGETKRARDLYSTDVEQGLKDLGYKWTAYLEREGESYNKKTEAEKRKIREDVLTAMTDDPYIARLAINNLNNTGGQTISAGTGTMNDTVTRTKLEAKIAQIKDQVRAAGGNESDVMAADAKVRQMYASGQLSL